MNEIREIARLALLLRVGLPRELARANDERLAERHAPSLAPFGKLEERGRIGAIIGMARKRTMRPLARLVAPPERKQRDGAVLLELLRPEARDALVGRGKNARGV